jgi:ribosomal protein S12 methylthiotransferase accessory factor
MEVTFPGGKRVDALYAGFTIRTDQRLENGGEGSAPAPYDLFMASIATCVGIYVLSFLQTRGLTAEGAGLTARFHRDPETRRMSKIEIVIKLPAGFPAKYRDAIVRVAEQCSVERTIKDPPEFVTSVTGD